MPYPATPKTWVAGDILTAAQLNAELRDALLAIFPLGPPDAAWTAFTPTIKFGATAATIVNDSRYTRVGRLIVANYAFRFTNLNGGTGVMSGTFPVTPRAVSAGSFTYINPYGPGAAIDGSAGGIYHHFVTQNAATDWVMRSPASPQVTMTNTVPFAVAVGAAGTGDEVYATITYESAA